MPDLMWLFAIPFIASFLLFLGLGLEAKPLKWLAVGLSLVPLALLLYENTRWLGAGVKYPWWPAASIHFRLAIDSLSLLFLFLTALIIPIALAAVRSETLEFPSAFFGLVLLLQGLLIGFFTARDLVVFTFFYEAMLLPLYFLINTWGGPKRQSAAMKFLIYMIAGSALMVAAVLAQYFMRGTFNLDELAAGSKEWPYAAWLCGIFLLAFAVKTPLFPFHGWLPDAYYQASTTGTILLSSLLSKAGIYGILRVVLELFPTVIKAWSPFLLGLAIAGVFYAGLAAWREKDFKRLIAYSSLSHVNFILAGLFVWSQMAHSGAIVQAINHGVTIAGLFLVAGWLEERLRSTAIKTASGLAQFLPHLCWLTLFFVLSSVALPGMNNFIGELMILLGLFGKQPWLTAFLTLSVILAVMYMLRWMQKMYFEAPSPFKNSWLDITEKELAIALPLIAAVLWIGLYPTPILKQSEPAAERIQASATLETQS
jgi:NADH-quinone oxidoreductase subunit M